MPEISKTKPIVILIIIIGSAFIGVSFFSYFETSRSIRRELVVSSLPLLSENIYSEIKGELAVPINISSAMARDSFLINWVNDGEADTGLITQYLGNLKKEYGFFSTFYVSAVSGKYYYHDGVLKTINRGDSHDDWYYSFIESDKDYDLDVDTNEAADNRLTVFINYRLRDFDGTVLGVTGVGIRLDTIYNTLKEKQDRYSRRIYMVDDQGIIQVVSDQPSPSQISIFEEEGIRTVADQLMVETDKPVDTSYTGENGKVLVSSRYIPEMDWHILVEQREDEALARAKDNLVISLIIGSLTTAVLVFFSSITIGRYKNHIDYMASTDVLTQVSNRRVFESRFEVARYRNRRYDSPYSLIIVDLDNFKPVNDTLGHLTGDRVLIEISALIKNIIRPDDLLARWGGDEFVILMEADEHEAMVLAERIRKAVEVLDLGTRLELSSPLTVSMGVAGYRSGEDLAKTMSRADRALYISKENGRNRVSSAS